MTLLKRIQSGSLLTTITGLVVFVSFNSCGKPVTQEELDGSEKSSIENFVRADRNFATLIKNYGEGRPAHTPWLGWWWAFNKDGIAAPATKYDAAHCNTTHAAEWEVRYHGRGRATKDKPILGWEGHCNGWSAAAALFDEPREPVTVNGHRFEVSDLKAILSEAGMLVDLEFFGNKMEKGDTEASPKYQDVVPGMFFLIMTNYMGKKKYPVNIDQDTWTEVWNQPVAGYRFTEPKPQDYLGKDPRLPNVNVYRINVRAQIWWATDNANPGDLNSPFTWQQDNFSGPVEGYESRILDMELWLDGPVTFDEAGKIVSSGNVIVTRKGISHVGGVWKLDTTNRYLYPDLNRLWPDYMWVPYAVQDVKDHAENLIDHDVNDWLDVDWIKKHLLVPGGANDPTYASNCRVLAVPSVRPSSTPGPVPMPSRGPVGAPPVIPSPVPSPAPRH